MQQLTEDSGHQVMTISCMTIWGKVSKTKLRFPLVHEIIKNETKIQKFEVCVNKLYKFKYFSQITANHIFKFYNV